jgi:hypothetical protein
VRFISTYDSKQPPRNTKRLCITSQKTELLETKFLVERIENDGECRGNHVGRLMYL